MSELAILAQELEYHLGMYERLVAIEWIESSDDDDSEYESPSSAAWPSILTQMVDTAVTYGYAVNHLEEGENFCSIEMPCRVPDRRIFQDWSFLARLAGKSLVIMRKEFQKTVTIQWKPGMGGKASRGSRAA